MSVDQKKLHNIWKAVWPTMVAIILSFIIGGILIMITGKNPLAAYASMFNGAFGTFHRLAETLVKTTTLTIMALGTSIAFRCKLWNIGSEGQFLIGSIFAMTVAMFVPAPNYILFPLTFIAAFIGGGLWGALAGWLKIKFNASEVITTIMLNYVAVYLLSWLVRNPLIDPDGHNFPQSPMLDEGLRLPILLEGTRLNLGFVIAILLIIAVYIMWRSPFGFGVVLTGESHEVARYSGINVKKTALVTMFISAGVIGLAGWTDTFGIHYRLIDGIADGYGNLSVVIALLGNLHPVGIGLSSFFFGILIVGGNTMKRLQGIPFSIVHVIQGLVIIFVISKVVFKKWGDKIVKRNL